jgi:hypothetical protein
VDEYVYLGSCVTKYRDEPKDVKRRLGLADNAHNFLLPVLKSRDVHRQTEKKIIIIIFINCKWVGTRWQWLFYVYTECDIDYY